MKKIRLKIDALRVESFPTVEKGDEQGTVRGHEDSWGCSATCYSCAANGATCDRRENTCQFESCDAVCDTWLCSI